MLLIDGLNFGLPNQGKAKDGPVSVRVQHTTPIIPHVTTAYFLVIQFLFILITTLVCRRKAWGCNSCRKQKYVPWAFVFPVTGNKDTYLEHLCFQWPETKIRTLSIRVPNHRKQRYVPWAFVFPVTSFVQSKIYTVPQKHKHASPLVKILEAVARLIE